MENVRKGRLLENKLKMLQWEKKKKLSFTFTYCRRCEAFSGGSRFCVGMKGNAGGGELQCANFYQSRLGGDGFPPREKLSASLFVLLLMKKSSSD